MDLRLDSEEDIENLTSIEDTETKTAENLGKDADVLRLDTEVITLSDSDREDGEVRDDSFDPEDLQRYLCKFFLRGGCAFGDHCRFYHMSDKGLYSMFERPNVMQQLRPPVDVRPPRFYGVFERSNAMHRQRFPVGVRLLPPTFGYFQEVRFRPAEDEIETSWDRALKEAREIFKLWRAPRPDQPLAGGKPTAKTSDNESKAPSPKPAEKTESYTCEPPPVVKPGEPSESNDEPSTTTTTDVALKSRPVKQSVDPIDYLRSSSKKWPPLSKRVRTTTTASSRKEVKKKRRDRSVSSSASASDRRNSGKGRNRSRSVGPRRGDGKKRRSFVPTPSSDTSSWTSDTSAVRKRRSAARPSSSDTSSWTSDTSAVRKRRSTVRSSKWDTSSSCTSDSSAVPERPSPPPLPLRSPVASPWTSKSVPKRFFARDDRKPFPERTRRREIWDDSPHADHRHFQRKVCIFYARGRCAFGKYCRFLHTPEKRFHYEDFTPRRSASVRRAEVDDVDSAWDRTLKDAEEMLRLCREESFDDERRSSDAEIPIPKTVEGTRRFSFKSSVSKHSTWSSRRHRADDGIEAISKTKGSAALKSPFAKRSIKKSVEGKKEFTNSYVGSLHPRRRSSIDDDHDSNKKRLKTDVTSKSRPAKRESSLSPDCRRSSRKTSDEKRRSPSSSTLGGRNRRNLSFSLASRAGHERRSAVPPPPCSDTSSWTSDTSAALGRRRSAARPSSSSSSSSDSSSFSASVPARVRRASAVRPTSKKTTVSEKDKRRKPKSHKKAKKKSGSIKRNGKKTLKRH